MISAALLVVASIVIPFTLPLRIPGLANAVNGLFGSFFSGHRADPAEKTGIPAAHHRHLFTDLPDRLPPGVRICPDRRHFRGTVCTTLFRDIMAD